MPRCRTFAVALVLLSAPAADLRAQRLLACPLIERARDVPIGSLFNVAADAPVQCSGLFGAQLRIFRFHVTDSVALVRLAYRSAVSAKLVLYDRHETQLLTVPLLGSPGGTRASGIAVPLRGGPYYAVITPETRGSFVFNPSIEARASVASSDGGACGPRHMADAPALAMNAVTTVTLPRMRCFTARGARGTFVQLTVPPGQDASVTPRGRGFTVRLLVHGGEGRVQATGARGEQAILGPGRHLIQLEGDVADRHGAVDVDVRTVRPSAANAPPAPGATCARHTPPQVAIGGRVRGAFTMSSCPTADLAARSATFRLRVPRTSELRIAATAGRFLPVVRVQPETLGVAPPARGRVETIDRATDASIVRLIPGSYLATVTSPPHTLGEFELAVQPHTPAPPREPCATALGTIKPGQTVSGSITGSTCTMHSAAVDAWALDVTARQRLVLDVHATPSVLSRIALEVYAGGEPLDVQRARAHADGLERHWVDVPAGQYFVFIRTTDSATAPREMPYRLMIR